MFFFSFSFFDAGAVKYIFGLCGKSLCWWGEGLPPPPLLFMYHHRMTALKYMHIAHAVCTSLFCQMPLQLEAASPHSRDSAQAALLCATSAGPAIALRYQSYLPIIMSMIVIERKCCPYTHERIHSSYQANLCLASSATQ